MNLVLMVFTLFMHGVLQLVHSKVHQVVHLEQVVLVVMAVLLLDIWVEHKAHILAHILLTSTDTLALTILEQMKMLMLTV